MAAILNVLLDLALLPTGRRVAELSIEQVMTDHRAEARVDISQLAAAHLIHGRLHVVVDTSARNAAPRHERVVVRVEQHLVRLQQVSAQEERSAMTELELRDLQLGALAVDDGPVLAPIELEGLARREGQRNICITQRGLNSPPTL